MAGYDGAGTLFALGMRLTKLDATGVPMVGADTCYVTDALVQIAPGLAFTENEAITQNNGRGQPCVSYQAPDTLLNGTLDPIQVCTPDPHILEFLIGGAVILTPSEVQTLTITGTPTGGVFTLTFDSQETSDIDYDATAAEVQTALEGLSNVEPGDVVCAGGPLPGTAVTITFAGQYAGVDVALITSDDSGLTGGTTPATAVVTTTPGGSGDAIGYRAPEVNTTPVPHGVAIEAWTNAILDNAVATVRPYFHHVWPKCTVRMSESLVLGAEGAGTPQFTARCEKNTGFGTGPVADIAFATDRVWQYVRVASNPTDTPGFVTVS